jgi:hypothetical protein
VRPLGTPDFQDFVDTGLNDPAELAALARKLGRPRKPSPGLLTGAGLLLLLLAGILIGRFVL